MKVSFFVTKFKGEMFGWLYKWDWVALFFLLTFKHLLTYFGQGPVPYAAVTKMKKAQACPEVAHSQAIEDTGGKQLQKHVFGH